MNEAETRRRIIDEQLRLAGWKIKDPSQIVAELDLFLATKANRSGEPHAGYNAHQFFPTSWSNRVRVGFTSRASSTFRLG